MQLSERTELLDRFFQNGLVFLKLSQDQAKPTQENKNKLNQACMNMELLARKIEAFDQKFYGYRPNRPKKGLQNPFL
jgi:hypothetical protein